MPPLRPIPGLVIRYAFLWRDESRRGRAEARKDRPGAVIVVAPTAEGERVYVLPITHAPPTDPDGAIEVPQTVRRHLGLDDDRSWIVLDEVNDFIWPGFDARAVPGSRPARIDYGVLPPRFFETVRRAFMRRVRDRRARRVSRD